MSVSDPLSPWLLSPEERLALSQASAARAASALAQRQAVASGLDWREVVYPQSGPASRPNNTPVVWEEVVYPQSGPAFRPTPERRGPTGPGSRPNQAPLPADGDAAAAADWLRRRNAELYALRFAEEQQRRAAAQTQAGLVDVASYPMRRVANFGANVMRDLTGGQTQEMNLSPARNLVAAAYPLGEMNILPFNTGVAAAPAVAAAAPTTAGPVVTPVTPVTPTAAGALPSWLTRPGATTSDFRMAGMASSEAGSTPAPAPAQPVAVVPAPAAVVAPMMQSNTALALDPVQAVRVDVPSGGSELDRWGRARFEQNMLAGGRAGLLRAEQAARLDDITQLRQTPQYLAEFQASLVNAGGDRAAAQALTDQRFLAASTDPNMVLGLTENNTAGMIDNLLSRQAAAAMEAGQAELPNRASSAAAEAGYYGPGILPYGTAPDAPGFLVPGSGAPVALTGYDNVPGTYSAAARAVAGVGASQARADAAEASIQQLIASGASAASVNAMRLAQARALAVRNDPAVRYAEMIREQEARAAGRGGSSADLMNLLAPQP